MGEGNKSKEELIGELTELRTILNVKNGFIEKLLENNRILSQTTLELVNLPGNANIYEFSAKTLNKLIENSIVIIDVYDAPSDSYQVLCVVGDHGKLNKISEKFLGVNLNDIKVPNREFNEFWDEKSRNTILSGKLTLVEEGLYQLLCGCLPQKIARMVESNLNIGDIYGSGFKSKGKLYGMVNILLKKGSELENRELVQSLINLFAVVMQRRNVEMELEKSEKKYRKIFENVQDVFYQTDQEGIITEISPSIERYSGFKPEELIGRSVGRVYAHFEDRKKLLDAIGKKGEVADYEVKLKNKSGDLVYASTNAHFIFDSNNNPIGVEGSLRDISARKKTEEMLLATRYRLSLALDLAKMGSWAYDVKSDTFTFDDQFYHLYGTTIEEQGGSQMSSQDYATKFIPPEEISVVGEEIERAMSTDDSNYSNQLEHTIIRVDGEKRFIIVRDGIEKDENGKTIKIYGVNQDITERKKAEDAIKKALEEKEILLKEIHHRVKNNLMVISSLLNLQSQHIRDKQALNIFKESQNRAKSMALIHERLYRSTDLKRIDFGDYIRTLTTELYRTYVSDSNSIGLNFDLEDVMVDINTTVPLGLILNELITNSMKHAFPDGREGVINVEFHRTDDEFILIIGDTGVGFPEDLDFRNTKSLGLQLVNNLTHQIDGTIELDRSQGTEFKITFKEQYK